MRDEDQKKGVGTELLSYLTYLAKREGLYGFTAEVLVENQPMLRLFEKMGFDIQKRSEQGVYELQMAFRGAYWKSPIRISNICSSRRALRSLERLGTKIKLATRS